MLIGNSDGKNHMFRNNGLGNGSWEFKMIRDSNPIVSASSATYAVAWADVDGDGDLVRRSRLERNAEHILEYACSRRPA